MIFIRLIVFVYQIIFFVIPNLYSRVLGIKNKIDSLVWDCYKIKNFFRLQIVNLIHLIITKVL